jgi:hypothetical protein
MKGYGCSIATSYGNNGIMANAFRVGGDEYGLTQYEEGTMAKRRNYS